LFSNKAYIDEQLTAGVWDATVLLCEPCERGYQGGYTVIKALYGLYLTVVGIREMHGTTTERAVAVVLLPFGLLFLLLALAALGLIVALLVLCYS
jgi:hypothetical protein